MRLIDADKLEISMIAEFNDDYGDTVPVYGVTAEDIDNAPTVDAGVKCGEWIKKPVFPGKDIPMCSECTTMPLGLISMVRGCNGEFSYREHNFFASIFADNFSNENFNALTIFADEFSLASFSAKANF